MRTSHSPRWWRAPAAWPRRAEAALAVIELRAFGPVTVRIAGGEPPARLLWRKHLALLVYLALSPRRTRGRDQVIGLLWADKPEAAARHSLNEAVRVLRRAAGDDALQTVNGQLRLDRVDCDIDRFDALVRSASWVEAAALVEGDFLEGFSVPGAHAFEDWLSAERAKLRGRAVDALVRASEALLAAGHAARAAEAGQRAAGIDPLSDAAARAAMRALALTGERGLAIGCFRRLERDLDASLGSTPDPATIALAARIGIERPAPAPPRAADLASRRPPLVGRAMPLSQLLGCWQDAAGRPAPALMIVDGEAGMGKSRLADEVAARARLAGAAVTIARAVEGDVAEPWNGLLALAGRGLLEARGSGAAAPGALARLAEALPEWADRFPGARGAEGMNLGRAFAAVLRAAAEEQPVLLLVDDAQWLDRESLLAILASLRDLAGLPLGVLLTVAPHAVPAALDEARARIGRDHPGCAVRLEPLAEADISELARWALPRLEGAALERLVRRVRIDSAGLPLLTFELLHAVSLGLELDPSASWPAPFRTLEETLPGDLPDSVVSAVRVAFNRLGGEARAVLCAAAVIGGRSTPAQLVAATGLTGAAVAAALDELEWGRWLESDARGYGFVARVIGEIVSRDMVTPGQRRRLLPARRDA